MQNSDQIQFDYGSNIETLFKVEPPIQKIAKGYGYRGVILRDKINDVIQCHICGKWYARLYMHTYQTHKINDEDYKKKFGLPLSFPLNSVNFSKKSSDNILKRWADPEYRKSQIEKMKQLGKHSWKKRSWKNHKYGKTSDAWLNKNGLCKEQVHRRYLVLCDNLGKQASNWDIHKNDPALHSAIRKHWGTFNKFKNANGYEVIKAADKWSQDAILASIRKYYRVYGYPPSAASFRGQRINGYPSHETVRQYFGSWNRAIESAGFNQKYDCARS